MPTTNENLCPHRDMHPDDIAALCRVARVWKQTERLTDVWISKIRYIHTMEHYSAIKRKEILMHATTQMKPETIILCARI